jgi:hypothetical protein
MSRRVGLILVTRQENVILPKVNLIMVKHVHVVVKVRYSEPKFN